MTQMKEKTPFLIFILLIFFLGCNKDNVTVDEYEIINLFTQQIIPPPPDFKIWDKLSEENISKAIDESIKKDSIEKSKINFTIYFQDSLTGLKKDLKINYSKNTLVLTNFF